MFLHHLIHLPTNSLAFEVLEIQRKMEIPSLWMEGLKFLLELDIKIEELHELSKQKFKQRVKSAAEEKNRMDLIQMIEPYKKLNYAQLSVEDFGTKRYFQEMNLSQARVMFALDTKMLKTVKSHYPSDRKNEEDLWECQHCSRIDSIRHLIRCPFFEDLRIGKNLNSNEEDIVDYFQQIVNLRIENEQAQHL